MGFVGFTYLIIFLVILYYVILLAILAGGFALFYWGLRSHRKPENEKKGLAHNTENIGYRNNGIHACSHSYKRCSDRPQS